MLGWPSSSNPQAILAPQREKSIPDALRSPESIWRRSRLTADVAIHGLPWRLCPSDARNGLTRSYRRDSNFLFAHPPRIVGIVCKVLRRIMIPPTAGPYA